MQPQALQRRSVSAAHLPRRKQQLLFSKLFASGIDLTRCEALLDASDAEMKDLAAAWPIFQPSYIYDAVSLLGFGDASATPLPKPSRGEVVIHYGGWSLQELCNSVIGKQLMHDEDWHGQYDWSHEKFPAGIYHLRIPVRGSNDKDFDRQRRLLSVNEQVGPAVLVASALLCHQLQTGEDLLQTTYVRCREKDAKGIQVRLYWHEGRLHVCNHWELWPYNSRVWLSSVRTSGT